MTELCSDAPYLDIIKITANEMDAFLQEKMGISLAETKKTGLDSFYYLEQYDSYYLIMGDSNFDWCMVTSGTWESNNKLILKYEKEYEGSFYKRRMMVICLFLTRRQIKQVQTRKRGIL